MTLNVTQKILLGYVIGFCLLLAFATLTLLNGKKIEATTAALSQEKIPGLIAVASLKSHVQTQSNLLYALYAANDQTTFAAQHAALMTAQLQDIANARALAEFKPYEAKLTEMSHKQEALTTQFVQIMRGPEVDWDAARDSLSTFSTSANEMGAMLDELVKTVSNQTLEQANASRLLTEQLINIALILSAVTFFGVMAMAYYSHQKVAVPLKEISNTLTGIASRKDLTQRVKQRSDDEIGAITLATNNLLEEFQKLARTLDGTAQEVNRTAKNLTDMTEKSRLNMVDKNAKLRLATQQFMGDIQASVKNKTTAIEVDIVLHRAQIQFIQSHLNEIDDGKQATDQHVTALQTSTLKLQKLAENMQGQIRLLNF